MQIPKKKKVIFIGGTSYCGSTMLDLILSNDEKGFSCGEVHALFWPYRLHHLNFECGCKNVTCKLWSEFRKNGELNFYSRIFRMFPNLTFIVDSSKNPFWIKYQSENLKKNGFEVQNILIWKTPLEFAHSSIKRNKNAWKKEWINYHKAYFTLVEDFFPVKYSNLVQDVEYLNILCKQIDIPYFVDKHKYWNKVHHTLFGNLSARIHLINQKDNNPNSANYNIQTDSNFRKIYYNEITDQKLINSVDNIISNDHYIKKICNLLLQNKTLSMKNIDSALKHNFFYLTYRKYRRLLHSYYLTKFH